MALQAGPADLLQAHARQTGQQRQRHNGKPPPALGRQIDVQHRQGQRHAAQHARQTQQRRHPRARGEQPVLVIVSGFDRGHVLGPLELCAAHVAVVLALEQRLEDGDLIGLALVAHVDLPLDKKPPLPGPVDGEIAKTGPLDQHQGQIRLALRQRVAHGARAHTHRRHGLAACEHQTAADEHRPVQKPQQQKHPKQQPVHRRSFARQEAQIKKALRQGQTQGHGLVVLQRLLLVQDRGDHAVPDLHVHVVVNQIAVIAAQNRGKALKAAGQRHRNVVALDRTRPGRVEQRHSEVLAIALIEHGLSQMI